MGVILTIISVILSALTLWIGYIFSSVKNIITFNFKNLNEYFFDIAVSIDQLGNVIMRDVFNLILIKSISKNKFGDEDETISSVLGKNQETQTLTGFGQIIVKTLDFIDSHHSLNSIEHRIKIKNRKK